MSPSTPQKISMSLLRFDPDAYPRFRVDASRVAMFEDVIGEHGAGAVPSPEVIHDGKGGYTVVEGMHRLLAFRNLGYKAVEVVTIDLPAGLTPTQAAFERAVETERKNELLKTYWAIPDRQIETSVVLANPPLDEA